MHSARHRVALQRLLWTGVALAWSVFALARGDAPLPHEIRLHDLPAEARHTLQLIQHGGPYPHERDGVVFGNIEKLLPAAQRGYYREYTVPTPGVRHRGARRMVVGCERAQLQRQPAQQTPGPLRLARCRDGGELYYTADHYRTFRRIVE
jgi:ribonuclease T1